MIMYDQDFCKPNGLALKESLGTSLSQSQV